MSAFERHINTLLVVVNRSVSLNLAHVVELIRIKKRQKWTKITNEAAIKWKESSLCVNLLPTNMIELDACGNNFGVIKINEVVIFFYEGLDVFLCVNHRTERWPLSVQHCTKFYEPLFSAVCCWNWGLEPNIMTLVIYRKRHFLTLISVVFSLFYLHCIISDRMIVPVSTSLSFSSKITFSVKEASSQ